MSFRLATVVSVYTNPFNFVNAHFTQVCCWCIECTLITLTGLLLTTMGCRNDNLGARHCLTKCALENKLPNQNRWSWYHFPQEKLPHTVIPVIASTYCGKYISFRLIGPPCIIINISIIISTHILSLIAFNSRTLFSSSARLHHNLIRVLLSIS